MVNQAIRIDVVSDRLRGLQRLVGDEDGLAVLDADHQFVNQLGLLRVVAGPNHRLVEDRAELVDVFQGFGAQRGPNLLEGPLSSVPEDGPGQRFQEAAAQVKSDGLVVSEVQARLGFAILHVPGLAAKIADDFFERKPHPLKSLQVAADRLFADVQFVDHILDGHAVMPGTEVRSKTH